MSAQRPAPGASVELDGTSVYLPVPDALLDALADRVAARVLDALGGVSDSSPSSPWLDVGAAAGYLCCKPRRLHDLVSQSRIPHYREGGRLMFRRSELDEWITSGRSSDTRVTPPSDRPSSCGIAEPVRTRNPHVRDAA